MKRRVVINDPMQHGYDYYLTEPMGRNFDPGFEPQLTPSQRLRLGVFGGKYMTDCRDEFPPRWLAHAKLCPDRHDPGLNYFGVNASQSPGEWRSPGTSRTSGTIAEKATCTAAEGSGRSCFHWANDSRTI